jgi:AcrR family transcriptional regulator
MISRVKHQDPRVKRTLQIFYDAFTDLLREKHYEFISVQDITHKANLNRATFYAHFKNKSDFIDYCSQEGLRRELESAFKFPDFSYDNKHLEEFVRWMLDFIARTYDEWHIKWDEFLFENAIRIELYTFLIDWMEPSSPKKQEILDGIDVNALVLSSSITGLGITWCHTGRKESIDELASSIAKIFIDGLPNLNP